MASCSIFPFSPVMKRLEVNAAARRSNRSLQRLARVRRQLSGGTSRSRYRSTNEGLGKTPSCHANRQAAVRCENHWSAEDYKEIIGTTDVFTVNIYISKLASEIEVIPRACTLPNGLCVCACRASNPIRKT